MSSRYAIFKKLPDHDPLLVEEIIDLELAGQRLLDLSSHTEENYALCDSGREILSTADAGHDKFEIRRRLFFGV